MSEQPPELTAKKPSKKKAEKKAPKITTAYCIEMHGCQTPLAHNPLYLAEIESEEQAIDFFLKTNGLWSKGNNTITIDLMEGEFEV